MRGRSKPSNLHGFMAEFDGADDAFGGELAALRAGPWHDMDVERRSLARSIRDSVAPHNSAMYSAGLKTGGRRG